MVTSEHLGGYKYINKRPKTRRSKTYILFDLYQKQNLFTMHISNSHSVDQKGFLYLSRQLIPLIAVSWYTIRSQFSQVICYLVHFSKDMAGEDITKAFDYGDLVP